MNLTAPQALTVYEACRYAATACRTEMKLERSKPYRRAIALELSDYEALMDKIRTDFNIKDQA